MMFLQLLFEKEKKNRRSKCFHLVREVEVNMSLSSVIIMSVEVLRKPACVSGNISLFSTGHSSPSSWVQECPGKEKKQVWVSAGWKSKVWGKEKKLIFPASHAELIDKHSKLQLLLQLAPRNWPRFHFCNKKERFSCCSVVRCSVCFRDKTFVR